MPVVLLYCARCAVGRHSKCRAERTDIPPNGAKKAPYTGMHDYPYGRQCPCANARHGAIAR